MRALKLEAYLTKLGLECSDDLAVVYSQLVRLAMGFTDVELVAKVAAASILLVWYEPHDLFSVVRYSRDPNRKEREEADRTVQTIYNLLR